MELLDTLNDCTVCFNKFDLKIHIPRILPCSHSLCEVCIDNLLENSVGKKLVCAECRTEHNILEDKGSKTFPQNKYIVTHLQRKILEEIQNSSEKNEKVKTTQKCPTHGEEITMFCLSDGCLHALCRKCLKEHKLHWVANIDEAPIQLLEIGHDKLLTLKSQLDEDTRNQLDALAKVKREEFKRIEHELEKKKTTILGEKDKNNALIEEKLSILNDSKRVLSDIKEERGNENDPSYYLEITTNINICVKSILEECDKMYLESPEIVLLERNIPLGEYVLLGSIPFEILRVAKGKPKIKMWGRGPRK